jgi:hypothetical protein
VSDGDDQSRASEVLEFRDVVVTPFAELLDSWLGGNDHKGGPAWPDWDSQRAARHCRRGSPIDVQPDPATPVTAIQGPIAWGGPVVHHFGHQIGDFSMRLLPTVNALPGVPIAFASSPRHKIAPGAPPDWFWGILDWLGIPRDHVVFVSEPTLVHHLCVLPQAEQPWGPGPNAAALDELDALVDERLGHIARSGAVYVSRAAHVARLAAEEFLEQALGAAGVAVIRPEDLPLGSIDLLPTYASADQLIFTEGSAMHAMQLLGRGLGDLIVINRRTMPLRFAEKSLEPRVRSLSYIDAARTVICPLRPDGKPAFSLGITILDPEHLLKELTPFLPGLSAHMDLDAYRQAQSVDVLRWLAKLDPWWTSSPESLDHLLATIREAGVALGRSLDEP